MAKRTLLEALVIVAAALVLGAMVNARRPNGLPLDTDPRTLDVGPGVELLDLQQARQAFDHGAVFVDARPRAVFERGHVEGAIALPPGSYQSDYRNWWEFIPTDDRVVVYAGAEEASVAGKRARWLIEMGHKGAVVFYDGWDAWQSAGLPTAKGAE
jgi:rhodanese-related sulfurtransferase